MPWVAERVPAASPRREEASRPVSEESVQEAVPRVAEWAPGAELGPGEPVVARPAAWLDERVGMRPAAGAQVARPAGASPEVAG